MDERHEPEDHTNESPVENDETTDDAAPDESVDSVHDDDAEVEDVESDDDEPLIEAEVDYEEGEQEYEAVADSEEADALPELDVLDELPPMPDTDFDIVGALEQVSALSDVIAEQEAREAEEEARIEAAQRAAEEKARHREAHYFPRPSEVMLERGQLASVIPALLLIIVGAYLTFVATSSEESVLTAGTLVAAGAGAAGLTLIAYWFSSRRWLSGSLFAGLSILFVGGTIFYLAEAENWQGWPLVVSAVGVSTLLSALLSIERYWDQAFAGLLLITAGVIGTVVTTEALGEQITDLAETTGPVILGVIVLVVTIPGLLRRRA